MNNRYNLLQQMKKSSTLAAIEAFKIVVSKTSRLT